MQVTTINHMGNDLSVVNAARISFGKRKEIMDSGDAKLIKYLAKHNHWSPIAHNSITFYITVPQYTANIIGGHKIGLLFTEKSKNYESYVPEFYCDNDGEYLRFFNDTKQKYGLKHAINSISQNVLSSGYLTGNVYSFSKLYNFHKNGNDDELKCILKFINIELLNLFPESWKALIEN